MIEFQLIDDTEDVEVNLIDNTENVEVELIKEIDSYNQLKDKPSINNVTLTGNKTLHELGIQAEGDYPTTIEFETRLAQKVDKVSGKGLSTNDYTTPEKNKLASLENYDDTEIRQLIDAKQPRGNYLTEETDPTVPNHVKTITQNNITNWNNKQEQLVSGTNIKTINNTSILGSGNIEIESGGSDYEDLENLPSINDVELKGNKTSSDLGLYSKPSGGIPKTDLESDVQTSLGKADTAIQSLSPAVLKDGGSATQTITLSSGTGTTALGVKSMSTGSYISYSGTGGWLGSYGVSSEKKPVFYNGTSYTLAYTSDIPKVFYGTCATSAGTATKVVVCEAFTQADLVAGTRITIYFNNANSYNGQATLNINGTGAKNIYYNGTTTNARYMWVAGESVDFIYNGTQWATINGGLATTSYYGVAKLYNGAGSNSTALALTPNALYAWANQSICAYYSSNTTYNVGDRVRYLNNLYECNTAITSGETWNAAHWTALEPLQNQINNVEEQIANIEKISKRVYGIRRKITSNSSSTWERIMDNDGKVANATKDGNSITNYFDNIYPWSEIKSCNYNLSTGQVNAWYGEPTFKFDGTNGDVYTYIPKTYWKIYQEDDYDYILLANEPTDGFTQVDDFYISRYTGTTVSNVLHSYSGLVPTTSQNISQFRTRTDALGSKFSLLDWRYFVIQLLYLVEYADFNAQSKLGNGASNRKNLRALVSETSTNRAIIADSTGYYVGQIIRIGTSDAGSQIADAREITAIDEYSQGDVTGFALTFSGSAVNISTGNYICVMAQKSGQCDSLGMKSGCINNDSFHSVIYRGIENIFSNVWSFVDGINIKDHVAYVCKDHTQYESGKYTEPYVPVGYTNGSTNGWVKTLGFDASEPFIRFATEIGGGTNTYMTDFYHQNSGTNIIALVGGSFLDTERAGFWEWNLYNSLTGNGYHVGCRILIDK